MVGSTGHGLDDAGSDLARRTGVDPNAVRVHDDQDAAEAVAEVGAAAFTVGSHVVLGSEAVHDPLMRQSVLAHELAHAAQQEHAALPQDGLSLGAPHGAHEQAADRAADAVRDGAAPPAVGSVSSAFVQRQVHPARRPAPAEPADLYGANPGWSFWLLEDGLPGPPTLADALAILVRWRPALAAVALRSPPEFHPVIGGPYWLLRNPDGSVALRFQYGRSGFDVHRSGDVTRYGVDVFVPDQVGEAWWFGRPQATAGQAAAGQRGVAPPAQPGSGSARDPLLDAYVRHFGAGTGPATTSTLTPEMKLRLALELADSTLLGEIAADFHAAIRDPLFIATTIVLIAVYVGLWLAPDVTVTKVVAGGITLALLAMFTWQDLIGFARAWLALTDATDAATTEAELRAAGDRFLRVAGQVSFDILLMIAFWAAGRAFRPRLLRAQARAAVRATTVAEGELARARRAPGSGVDQPASATDSAAVHAATQAAGPGATSTQVLDALHGELPQDAARGLQAERARAGDARTLRTLRGRLQGGRSVQSWLVDRGLPPEARATAQEAVALAEARLARARLVQAGALSDSSPAVRQAARVEFLRNLRTFARALMQLDFRLRRAVAGHSVSTVVGELGEALGRYLLAQQTAPGGGQRIVSNLELARRLTSGTIRDYVAAERAAGRTPDVGRLRQGPGGVYESLGQIDNMVVEDVGAGRSRPVLIEEVKTGLRDAPSHARAQAENARTILGEIGAGSSDARVLERPTPNTVGADLTPTFDLAGSDPAVQTRGLPNRGFDTSLEIDRPALEEVARDLVTEAPVPASEPVLVAAPGARTNREH